MRQPNFRRGRGRGNPRRAGGGGGGGGRNQTFDSSGPNVKVRGTAAQVLEKYLALARDASASGDRIMAENYFQHAEHYHRVISANGAAQAKDAGPKGGNGQLNPESGSSDSSPSQGQGGGSGEKSETAPASQAAPSAEKAPAEERAPAAEKAPAARKAEKSSKSDKSEKADDADKGEAKKEEQAPA